MKDSYDLTSIANVESFPWDEIPTGIARSTKKASIFYGYNFVESKLTREQQMWRDAIVQGLPLKGLDILLTSAKNWKGSWYRLGIEKDWAPTENLQHFPRLQQWLKASNIFKEIGRQIVFIQLQNTSTPRHVDQQLNDAPEEYRAQPEFIWITSPNLGKRLFINDVEVSHITWFNSYLEHYTLPDSGLRWSIRVDGKFTDEFKKELLQQ